MKKNTFNRIIVGGSVSGSFNIYQAKNGTIQLLMSDKNIGLTLDQINELSLDLYELVDFDVDLFQKAYKTIKKEKVK